MTIPNIYIFFIIEQAYYKHQVCKEDMASGCIASRRMPVAPKPHGPSVEGSQLLKANKVL